MHTENRLSKVLAGAGVASRRKCEELIFQGCVHVNGQPCLTPQTKVSLHNDRISVNGKKIEPCNKKVYYILNKPTGVICSHVRPGRKKIVLDLFESLPYRLFTVGRLDRDTSGLIIITNDGHFANRVIHPSSNITKEYLIRTGEEISHDHLALLGKGTFVEDHFVRPVKVRKIRRGVVKIAVKEGKKREVRSIAEQAGLTVLELKRIRIGGLELGSLPLGRWREMTEKEKIVIFS